MESSFQKNKRGRETRGCESLRECAGERGPALEARAVPAGLTGREQERGAVCKCVGPPGRAYRSLSEVWALQV